MDAISQKISITSDLQKHEVCLKAFLPAVRMVSVTLQEYLHNLIKIELRLKLLTDFINQSTAGGN